MNKKGKFEFMGSLSRKRREELEEIVETFLDHYSSFDISKDIIENLNNLGFSIETAFFKDKIDGMILVDETQEKLDGFSTNKVILVNANKDLYQSRFILMHELAHFIDKKRKNIDTKILFATRDHNIGYSSDICEQEMDYIAAALLLPKYKFTEKAINYLNEKNTSNNKREKLEPNDIINLKNDQYFIESIQKEFKVEKTLVERRLDEIIG